MKLKVNKNYFFPFDKKVFESDLVLTLRFSSINDEDSEISIEEFTWFLDLLFAHRNQHFFGNYNYFNDRDYILRRRYRKSLFPLSKGVKIRKIKKESPLLISLAFPELGDVLNFIILLVTIYGADRTRQLIIQIVQKLIQHIKNPKSIFIIEDDSDEDDDNNNEEYETLDLDKLPKRFNPPNWAEVIQVEFEENELDED